MTILDKKQMSEDDIKLNYITPAIQMEMWNLLQNCAETVNKL